MLGDITALLPEGTALREEALAPADAPVDRRPTVAPTLEVGAPSTRGPAEGNSVPPAPLDETRAAGERAAASGPRLGHLPAPLTSFIGRAREIEEVRRLLGGGARLLTLVGPGGTGKTRLALRVAAELRGGLEHGAGFVDLSPLADPAAIPQAIAAVLGAREEPGLPLEVTIARQLRAREILLVIDNCEHLIAGCAQLAERLLGACPRLRILATSREALSVDGETVFAVAPLSVPASSQGVTAEVALRSEAVRLFVERARAALPGFELRDEGAPAVVHVCQRLDGIPLAIELAAARVRAMSVEQIATRIRDRFGLLGGGRRTTARRQQTLRGLIDWSHDLLGAPERAMLRRASVFHGGFSLEAAEAVCAWPGDPAGVEPASVLDLVVQLASKSLVVADPEAGAGRYRLLETIRHYGWEKLQAAGEEGIVRERHLDFFRRLAEDAEPALRSGAQLTWLERLDAEHDNLRIALDFCQEPARREPGLRLAGALGRFWWLRGHHLEGCAWLERLLDRSSAGPAPATAEARAKALGQLALLLPSASQARPWWAESLAAYREAGDAWGIALSLLSAAEWELHEGDHGAARALLEEGLGRARATGDPWILAGILDQMGRYHRGRLELAEAVRRLEEGVALARATADRWLIGLVLLSLGLTRSFQGDHAPARALLEESLALQRSLGSKAGIAETLKSLGGALECLGEHGKAAACYEETLELARGLGSEALVAAAHLNLAHNALAVGAVAEVRRCLREAFLRWPEIARKDQVAWSLLVLGELARREGKPAQAARFFGAEQSLEETFGLGLHPPSRAGFEQILEALRAELGERAEAAWSEGRVMPLEEVLRSAVAYLTA
jgi:non-specific serine/threonine protein kinase